VAPVRAALGATGRSSSWRALREVLGTPASGAGFAVVAVAVTLLYTILLPFDYTQRFGLANWQYLSAGLLAWSVALGVAMALVLSVQVHAMRQVAAARVRTGAAGGAAFAVSLLSSFLCCTPIVPTVLAFVGVSGAGLYSTTGALQHFFATNQTGLLAGSLALLAASGWWGLRKVARAACLSGQCGPGDGPDASESRQQPGTTEADEDKGVLR
jgi:hypothetical protein